MSARHLPPLDFLPAFEAAGRLGSIKAAAAELHVTPSAVSQQIKAIEDALGVALFIRSGRSIALTREGVLYLREVKHALMELGSLGRRLSKQARVPVLRLSTVPLFAHEFLLPRLSEFRATFPELELQIESTMKTVDFASAEIDAAIRLGDGDWPGLLAHALGMVEAAPACSPALAERILLPADLGAHTLLVVRGQERHFVPLLSSCGLSAMPSEVLAFETCYEALHAAERGLGVTFGTFPVATHCVTSGRLAVPLAHRRPLAGRVFLVHRSGDESFPFSDIARWFQAEFEALPRLPEGRIVPTRSFRVVQQRA